jgi:Polyketide synthase modules and related proteins
MIAECLEKTKIHPRTISYVEAHGTGTSLGDPIEIAGLVNAYQKSGKDKQYCAIGSIKSNIGHVESASGIAGLTKVILQLFHRTLVPSLHSQMLNPHIDFENSPFFVQQKTIKWEQPIIKENGQEKEYPRRAGVSSFGAYGSNAHVILEEYIPKEMRGLSVIKVNAAHPVLVVLSAKNAERLKVYAERLLGFIKEYEQSKTEDLNLADIAYTLQVGRKAMDCRVTFLIKDGKDLISKLQAFIADREDIEDCYVGEVKQNKNTLGVFTADDDTRELIDKWIAKGKFGKLADLWVNGLALDWKCALWR